MVCFTGVKRKAYVFQFPLSNGGVPDCEWIADHIPCILALSISLSPFHLVSPQKFSFNSFEEGIS